MSKALEIVRTMINGANEYEKKTGDKNPPVYFSKNNLLIIEKELNRLEQIDNSNPSEALEALKDMLIGNGVNDNINDYVDNLILPIKQALQRLEAIDNANPSEALECLDRILHCNDDDYTLGYYNHDIELVKQALLKAQEPKKYLKWEDLEFDHKPKYIDVKMGDNKYILIVGFSDGGNEMAILQTKIRRHYFVESEDNKQFFNDLHLERVEE